jgi:chromate reductase, NAD(P)H dehydrogenase (quinone)
MSSLESSTSRQRNFPFEVVGFAGSLREGSFNRALLRAAVELAPSTLRIVEHDLKALPLYNADVEATVVPASVADLRDAVRRADALLIATPEYNHGVPGVLKNAIDWLSRPPRGSALDGKPAAIMGASPGMTGTARAQTQLREAFVFTNTYALLRPEVLVAHAAGKFDSSGRLTDPATRTFLTGFLDQFADWIGRFATP